MTKKNKMLPSGFYDLLFDDAKKDYYVKNILNGHFFGNGFNMIKPPLLEFKDNFNSAQTECSFSTIDAGSGRDLVLRSDITLQIARLLETRLKDYPLPLKLCYEGDVFVTKNDELYSDRQLTQSGFEIIGCQSDDFLEVIESSIDLTLQMVDRKSVFEISIPDFAKILCDEMGIEYDEDFSGVIKRKNLTEVRNLLDEEAGALFCNIMTNFSDLDFICKQVSKYSNSQKINTCLSKISLAADLIAKKFPEIEVCFDIFGDESGSYHKDVAFKIFCQGYSYPLAKGGIYDVCGMKSVGATFYVNHIRKII